MGAVTTIDPVIRKLVWERFERDRPNPGPQLDDWALEFSEETGVPATSVRRIVTEGAATVMTVINQRAATLAQQIAEAMGASLVSAFEMLREALHATKKKVLLDRQGRPKLIDQRESEGPGFVPENMIYVEVPDWNARLSAIRTIVEVFGARAPQQIEVNEKTVRVNLNLSHQDAVAELRRLSTELPRLQRAYAAIAEGDPGYAGEGEAITGSVIPN